MALASTVGPHVLISCGEASGDRYGASLVAALREMVPDLRVTALGGPALESAGADLIASFEDIAIMGFGEVLAHLRPIMRARRRVSRHLAHGGVDLLVPIDFPGFNLHLAAEARRRGVPVFYVVPPQLWAWAGWRLRALRRDVKRLGTILPFEPEWFGRRGVRTVHLGHPLMDIYGGGTLSASCREREQRLQDPQRPVTLGLLPGSRRQEIDRLLPAMQVAGGIMRSWLGRRQLRILVSRAPGGQGNHLASMVAPDAVISDEPLPRLLPQLDLAMVCSGTASLEASLAAVPNVVLYRTSWLNYRLARRLVRVPYIGLANLILERPLVPEHIQQACDPVFLAGSLLRFLNMPDERQEFYRGCEELRRRCGGPGAWKRASLAVVEMLSQPKGG